MSRVAVIGGGFAGLVAARRLAMAGVEVTVFEATDALGGLIQPAELGDLTIDIGAEAFAVRGGAVEALVRELGLEDSLVEPRTLGSWAYGADGAFPSPAGGMLGIPRGPDAPGLESAIGAEGVAAVSAEAALDASVGATAEAFAELVRARFGELVLQRLVAPVTRGVYSLDPELVDHRVLIPGIAERLAEHGSLSAVVAALRPAASPGALVSGLRGGMHHLVGTLIAECEHLGVRFALHSRVELTGPSAHVLADFDRIVVSTEAAFDTVTQTVSSEVVALLVNSPALDAHPRGTGVLVADATDVAAKALTHVTAKWEWLDEQTPPGQHLLRLSYGPAAEDGPARSLQLNDEELKAQALADASRILGVELDARNLVALARREWHMPPPAARVGRQAQLAEYRKQAAEMPNVELCGTWIDGTGLAAVLPATENAVQRILASL